MVVVPVTGVPAQGAGTDDELRAATAALFLAHQRPGIGVCGCGGMRLGESYPEHLADALLEGPLQQIHFEHTVLKAGVQVVRKQRDEACAQVQRVRDVEVRYSAGHTVGLVRQQVVNDLRRALDGPT